MRSKVREESAMDRPDPEYPDPDGDHTLSARRSHLARHLDNIRKGKAVPKQKLLTPKDTKDDDYEDHNRPRRSGPGSDSDSWDDRTHAEFTGDTKADTMSSRGVEADDYRAAAEKEIRGRERQALRSRRRSQRQQASTELVRGARLALAEGVLERVLNDELNEGRRMRNALLGVLGGLGLAGAGAGAYNAVTKEPPVATSPQKHFNPSAELRKDWDQNSLHKKVKVPGLGSKSKLKRLVPKTPFELADETDSRLNKP